MMKIAVLLAAVALCSAEITSYSYSALAPYNYPYYGFNSLPYTYPFLSKSMMMTTPAMVADAPLAKSMMMMMPAPAMVAEAPLAKTMMMMPAMVSGAPIAKTMVTPEIAMTPLAKSMMMPTAMVAEAPIAKTMMMMPAPAMVANTPIAKTMMMPAPVMDAAPAVMKTQYHTQDAISGSASYGHMETEQMHTAVQDAAGNKLGSFSHVLPDGSISRTDYVADAMGYRVASNSLPINAAAAPLPVSDTEEVIAARTAHMAEIEKVKSRSKRAIAYAGHYAHPLAYSGYAHHPMAYSGFTHPMAYSGYPGYSSYYSSPFVTPYAKSYHY